MHLHGVSALHRCASQITVTNENAYSMVLCSFAHAWTSTTIINCNPCKSPWNGNKTTWNVKQIVSNFARFYWLALDFPAISILSFKKEHLNIKEHQDIWNLHRFVRYTIIFDTSIFYITRNQSKLIVNMSKWMII